VKRRRQFFLYIFVISRFLLSTLGSSAHADDGVALHGFSDMKFIYDSKDDSGSFSIGDVDFFLAKPIDKNVNFLIEMAFQPAYDGVSVDLERSFVQYVVDPWLKVSVGRFHTSLGYWNDTYHHGGYLQTPITRPVMERFEDSQGLLPAHTTGIEVRGNGLMDGSNLGYIVNVGNGRGPVKDPPAFYYSYNKTHSFSLLLYDELPNGIRFGPNFYMSGLPGGFQKDGLGVNDPTNPGVSGREVIYGAHFIYNSPEVEFLTEYANIHHDFNNGDADPDGATSTNMDTLYTQFGYHFGLFTPYVRYEVNATDHPDAYLKQLTQTVRYYTAGCRYELTASSALKFEYVYANYIGGNHDWNSALDWAFTW